VLVGDIRHQPDPGPQAQLGDQAGESVGETGVGAADDDERHLAGHGGQRPHEHLLVLVRAVRADGEDESFRQLIPVPRRGHVSRGDGAELLDVDPVGHEGGMGGARIMAADFLQAGHARSRHRGRSREHHPGDHRGPGLAAAVARERDVFFDRGVVHRHDERARPQQRREGRIRDVEDGRVD